MNLPEVAERMVPDKRRVPELDGVRGVAILLVVIWHYIIVQIQSITIPYTSGIYRLFLFSWSGVDLFFVLSGFLIGGILLDNKTSPNYFKTFYVRRVFRIVPLYYLWLALFAVQVYLISGLNIQSAYADLLLTNNSIPLWSYGTLTQNFSMLRQGTTGSYWLGITWSLAIEEQFYLLLPAIIYFIPTRKLPYVLSGFIVSAPVLRALLIPINIGSNNLLVFCKGDALFLGVLIAYLIREGSALEHVRARIFYLYGFMISMFIAVFCIIYFSHEIFSRTMLIYGYSALALMYASFLVIAITEKSGPVSSITRNIFVRNLGLIAYGVYLFHQGINGLFHAVFSGQFPAISSSTDVLINFGSLIITVAFASLSWLYFEKQILRFGHTFTY